MSKEPAIWRPETKTRFRYDFIIIYGSNSLCIHKWSGHSWWVSWIYCVNKCGISNKFDRKTVPDIVYLHITQLERFSTPKCPYFACKLIFPLHSHPNRWSSFAYPYEVSRFVYISLSSLVWVFLRSQKLSIMIFHIRPHLILISCLKLNDPGVLESTIVELWNPNRRPDREEDSIQMYISLSQERWIIFWKMTLANIISNISWLPLESSECHLKSDHPSWTFYWLGEISYAIHSFRIYVFDSLLSMVSNLILRPSD